MTRRTLTVALALGMVAGLARADHVAEAECATRQAEHERVAGDQRFPGELGCAIGGDREQAALVLRDLFLAEIPIYAAPGGVQDALGHPRSNVGLGDYL